MSTRKRVIVGRKGALRGPRGTGRVSDGLIGSMRTMQRQTQRCVQPRSPLSSYALPVALHNMREAAIQGKYCRNMIHPQILKRTGGVVTTEDGFIIGALPSQ